MALNNESVRVRRISAIMSTRIWRKVLIVCALLKWESEKGVLSFYQDIEAGIPSKKWPKRGLESRLGPISGFFWTVTNFGLFQQRPGIMPFSRVLGDFRASV